MKFANTYTNDLINVLYCPVSGQNTNNENYQKYKDDFNKLLDTAIEKMVNNTCEKPKCKVYVKK